VLSKVLNIFGRSNIMIVGSNPIRGIDICLCFPLYVLSCVGGVLEPTELYGSWFYIKSDGVKMPKGLITLKGDEGYLQKQKQIWIFVNMAEQQWLVILTQSHYDIEQESKQQLWFSTE
jgi:hypothetical protein